MNERKMWGDKPYLSLNYYLKNIYGEKVYRLSLNGGMSCPNRDGTLDTRGCIFCSRGGSGDFAASSSCSVSEQLQWAKEKISAKTNCRKYIAYFQAFTNTYAPVDYLRKIFLEAISQPEVVILSIATRPDCIPDDVLDLLSELNRIKPVWIELGIQTIHSNTAKFIRSGFDYPCFSHTVQRLHKAGISVIPHLILGLPHESRDMMLESVDTIAALPISGIKLQLLHVLKDTDLADYYKTNPFPIFTRDEYCQLICDCLVRIPENVVIHRITGDGPRRLLMEPQWSTDKKNVLNQIHRIMDEQNLWQGKYCSSPIC